jgi:uncharacterized membrane protein
MVWGKMASCKMSLRILMDILVNHDWTVQNPLVTVHVLKQDFVVQVIAQDIHSTVQKWPRTLCIWSDMVWGKMASCKMSLRILMDILVNHDWTVQNPLVTVHCLKQDCALQVIAQDIHSTVQKWPRAFCMWSYMVWGKMASCEMSLRILMDILVNHDWTVQNPLATVHGLKQDCVVQVIAQDIHSTVQKWPRTLCIWSDMVWGERVSCEATVYNTCGCDD